MANLWAFLSAEGFILRAVLGGVLASVACGLMGPYVVVKRMGYMAGGISHAILGGMGIAFFAGTNVIGGALISAIAMALVIAWAKGARGQNLDTLISAFWALGMSVGIIFISQTPGYGVDLMSYLFGNILMITGRHLIWMLALCIAIAVFVSLFYKTLQAVAFDETHAELRGVPITMFNAVLLCLVATSIVILVQVVGIIMMIALLTLPAAIARFYAGSLPGMIALSIGLGVFFSGAGLALSYHLDWPSGATIILLIATGYLIAVGTRAVFRRRNSAF